MNANQPVAGNPPVPPVEPDAFSCCGNQCGDACVWTLYQHARKRYEEQLRAWQAQQDAAQPKSGD